MIGAVYLFFCTFAKVNYKSHRINNMNNMNILKSLIWLIPLALGLSACEYDNENPLPQDNIQVVTGEIHDITLTTVTLDGTVNPSSTKYKEVGIAYCIENSGDDLIYATATDHSYGFHNFSVTIRGLQPDRTYTYHAYLKDANGKLIHSDTKKIKKPQLPFRR